MDFAQAEQGSSQDEEEKAKYEFEFETEEEEYEDDFHLDEDDDEIPRILEATLQKPKRPADLELHAPPQFADKRPRKPPLLPPSPPDDLPMAPEPPIETHQPVTTTASTSRVSSKSLPENLYRSGVADDDDQKESNRMDRTRLPRTKSSTLGRLTKHRATPPLQFLVNQQYKGSIKDRSASGHDLRDLTPVQDIYSSDPSTAIDLSTANTVIERQREEEEEEEAEQQGRIARRKSTEEEELDAELEEVPEEQEVSFSLFQLSSILLLL